jgi:hypothetical protein
LKHVGGSYIEYDNTQCAFVDDYFVFDCLLYFRLEARCFVVIFVPVPTFHWKMLSLNCDLYVNEKQIMIFLVHPITGPEGPRGGVEVQIYPFVSLGKRRGWGG